MIVENVYFNEIRDDRGVITTKIIYPCLLGTVFYYCDDLYSSICYVYLPNEIHPIGIRLTWNRIKEKCIKCSKLY